MERLKWRGLSGLPPRLSESRGREPRLPQLPPAACTQPEAGRGAVAEGTLSPEKLVPARAWRPCGRLISCERHLRLLEKLLLFCSEGGKGTFRDPGRKRHHVPIL